MTQSLPRIQDTTDSLSGKNGLVFDQQKVYHQIYLDAASQSFYSVPLSLCNVPAEFLSSMEGVFFDIRDHFAFPYLADLLVFSKSF